MSFPLAKPLVRSNGSSATRAAAAPAPRTHPHEASVPRGRKTSSRPRRRHAARGTRWRSGEDHHDPRRGESRRGEPPEAERPDGRPDDGRGARGGRLQPPERIEADRPDEEAPREEGTRHRRRRGRGANPERSRGHTSSAWRPDSVPSLRAGRASERGPARSGARASLASLEIAPQDEAQAVGVNQSRGGQEKPTSGAHQRLARDVRDDLVGGPPASAGQAHSTASTHRCHPAMYRPVTFITRTAWIASA